MFSILKNRGPQGKVTSANATVTGQQRLELSKEGLRGPSLYVPEGARRFCQTQDTSQHVCGQHPLRRARRSSPRLPATDKGGQTCGPIGHGRESTPRGLSPAWREWRPRGGSGAEELRRRSALHRPGSHSWPTPQEGGRERRGRCICPWSQRIGWARGWARISARPSHCERGRWPCTAPPPAERRAWRKRRAPFTRGSSHQAAQFGVAAQVKRVGLGQDRYVTSVCG